MKKMFFFVISSIIAFSALFCACHKERYTDLMKMNSDQLPTSENTISLSNAIRSTANWQTYLGKIAPTGQKINAFFIPISDIQNLSLFKNVSGARAYLCLDRPNDLSSAHIILVPVAKGGKDILSIQLSDSTTQSSIYNLTQPCPTFCDSTDPLTGSDN